MNAKALSRLSLRALWGVFLISLLLPGLAAAQSFDLLKPKGGSGPLSPEEAFQVETEWQDDGTLAVSFDIAPGYYLYREHLTVSAEGGHAPVIETQPGEMKDDPNFGTVEVWHDHTEAVVSDITGPFTLHWQGCEEKGLCYPPQSREIVPPGGAATASASGATQSNQAAGVPDYAQSAAPSEPAATSEADTPTPPASASKGDGNSLSLSSDDGLVAGIAAKGGWALVVASFFGFGLLLAFTPCVLPMVPIVAGMLGAQGKDLTPARGLALTGTYVLAMAVAFGLLGIVAAWSGQNLQFLMQAPATVIALALLFAVLALSSFGLFELRLPQALTNKVSSVQGPRGTLAGAAILGFTSTLIVGPCVTAPLAGAFLYIAQTGDAGLGASALFALGLGQGVLLMAVGLFGSAILPRMGEWMVGVNRAFGFVFLGVAIWLLSRVVAGPAILALWALLLIGAGVALGGRDRFGPESSGLRRVGGALGVAALLAGALEGIGAASGAADPLRPLAPFTAGQTVMAATPDVLTEDDFAHVETPEALDAALAAAKGAPVMLITTAEWCTECATIAREVIPDPQVQAALRHVTPIAVDVTKTGAPQQALLKQLGVIGPPTLIFLSPDHSEAQGTRLIGDVTAPKLTTSLSEIAQ
ncbi:protein-disulfide reductase DsbD [Thioclava electrotropha]|uniref:protein-disulfide reductase DsbD n=1 Tax=Thioclava electrotropha TaxID=1549850 RepID=UPI0009F35382|nr:protein-disulfide reductase DsbD [Thioclava electrotropha]